MALKDLARQLPSDDILAHYSHFIGVESDRGAALMAAALVERALEDKIRTKLDDPEGGVADTWFEGGNAPFRTFSAKIALGRALRLYDDKLEETLQTVKNIRNAFAHSMIPLDFSHPTLAPECSKLKPPSATDDYTPRVMFSLSCLTLSRILGNHAVLKAYLTPPGSEDAAE